MSETVQPFEAEVGRVLDLVINSLYKEREIFLRELISNASDACDRLRYASLGQPELLGDAPELKITIVADPGQNVLTIADTGGGMDRDDLVANLGTIARSGTARFVEQLSGDNKNDMRLIGQFGVGFYSVFMVADKVVVTSRKPGDSSGWQWASDGRSGFTVTEAEGLPARGTSVALHLKDDAREFLDEWKLRQIVRTYSDHIALPIMLEVLPKEGDTTPAKEPAQVNEASALWTRSKSEISDEQYKEFYHHVAHAFDDPFARVHFTAEGSLTYTALLFVPSTKPFDLMDPRRRHAVKLYVRRVFITDELETLLPRYLRFTSGIVDSEDLQLNVSRETLQHGAIVARMRKTIVRRLLDELANRAKTPDTDEPVEAPDDDATDEPAKPQTYLDFWSQFGAVLKEGLYEDDENRDRILDLTRFRSTRGPDWTSLADYVERMKDGQDAIYTITGESLTALRSSPQLEEARAKGVEVLLLDDPVDEFWLPRVDAYKAKAFKSLTKGTVDLGAIRGDEETPAAEADKATDDDLGRLMARIKLALGDQVKDVRPSTRLRESAVCLVAEENGMDMRLERFLRQHDQLEQLSTRILEVNGRHDLIRRMAAMAKEDGTGQELDDLARLLLDQARIVEGEPLPDPGAFSRRMSAMLAKRFEA